MAVSSQPLAIFFDTSVKSPEPLRKATAPAAAPSSRAQLPGMATWRMKNARRAGRQIQTGSW